ncbi:MAG: hypothetical protein ABI895_41930, partial [Deltaproteobacteria bacterium]
MARPSPLDELLRRARDAEAPSAQLRAQVKSEVQRRAALASPDDAAFDRALSDNEPARLWPRLLGWGSPLVGLSLVALALSL